MRAKVLKKGVQTEFAKKVFELSGQNVFVCHQCGKCSASCPITFAMDFLPRQVIRLVQLEDKRALGSRTIWLCATCLICDIRCPKGIDLSRVMESLRQISLRKNIDWIKLSDINPNLPQIAVVSALRKFTG